MMLYAPTTAAVAALLLATVSSVQALSNADIQSVFGTAATDLTGSSIDLPHFTLSIVTNTTHALFNLNATTSKSYQVGWMGTGVGTAMVNADFLVSWPNPSPLSGPAPPAWTLSHRQSPNGESEPRPPGIPTTTTEFFHYLPALSSAQASTDSYTVVSYLRLLNAPANYVTSSNYKSIAREKTSFIFASSSVSPQNPADTAILTQHDQPHYAISLDLSLPISLASTTSTSTAANATTSGTAGAPAVAGSSDGNGITAATVSTARSSRDMILIAHAIFASLAFLVITPIAIMIPRYFRNRHWFPIHAALQITSFIFIIIAFALSVKGTQMGFQSNFFDGHTRLGLVIFILVTIQVIGGATAHRSRGAHPAAVSAAKRPTLVSRSPIRFAHIGSGILIVVLSWFQIGSGFDEYGQYSDSQAEVPRAVKIIFGILVAFWTAAYFFGIVREAMGGMKGSDVLAAQPVLEDGEKKPAVASS